MTTNALDPRNASNYWFTCALWALSASKGGNIARTMQVAYDCMDEFHRDLFGN